MTPSPYEPPAAQADVRPRAILWYRAYAGFMAMASLGFLGFGIMTAASADGVDVISASVLSVVMLALACLYVVATFVPFKPWGWTVGFVAIALGAAGCTLVVALPLLLQWTRPEVKAAFARL